MNKFKIGDKVVVDEDFHEKKHCLIPKCFKVGVPYVVVRAETALSGERSIKVDVDDTWWSEDRFKLYKEASRSCAFKPGNKYKTRDGREAIVYAVYPEQPCKKGPYDWPIHGAILIDGNWECHQWLLNGAWCGCTDTDCVEGKDLLPNKRTVYVNLWKNGQGRIIVGQEYTYDTEQGGRYRAVRASGRNYVAIAVPIEIEE